MYSNRELVEFFLSYKLSQRNYPISLLRPEDADGRTEGDKSNRGGASSSPGADIDAVKAALRDSADEFEQLFMQAFSEISSQLEITPDTAYHSFKSVMDEVFKDGVNWGRIVGLFAFGGVLCVECVDKGTSDLVSRIADWMTMYLDEHINPWIQSQGGWVSTALLWQEIYQTDATLSEPTMALYRRIIHVCCPTVEFPVLPLPFIYS